MLACFRDSILDSNILAPRLRLFNLLSNPILHSTFSGTPKAILVPRIRWPRHTLKQNAISQSLKIPNSPPPSDHDSSENKLRTSYHRNPKFAKRKGKNKIKIRTKRALQAAGNLRIEECHAIVVVVVVVRNRNYRCLFYLQCCKVVKKETGQNSERLHQCTEHVDDKLLEGHIINCQREAFINDNPWRHSPGRRRRSLARSRQNTRTCRAISSLQNCRNKGSKQTPRRKTVKKKGEKKISLTKKAKLKMKVFEKWKLFLFLSKCKELINIFHKNRVHF